MAVLAALVFELIGAELVPSLVSAQRALVKS